MTNEEIIKELSGKTVLEINELVKALEEAWGVSAAAAVAVAGPAAAAPAEEKTEFDVVLKAYKLHIQSHHLFSSLQLDRHKHILA